MYDENDVCVLVVLAAVYHNPHISSYEIEKQTGLSRTIIRRILRNYRYHPCHITLMQAITPNDMKMRLQFCRCAQQVITNNPSFFFMYCLVMKQNLKILDNRHNCHYWADIYSRWYRQIDNQHRWCINVWRGIINDYLIGPYIFDSNGQNFLSS